jgi:DNA-binding transcriptional ArsR family regulator
MVSAVLELSKVAQVVSSPSRLRIVEELMRGPKSAAELAAKLSLKPVTIHHHLPWLERAGVVEQAPPLRSGRPGRPTNRFRLTTSPLQINLPPREFQMLAAMLAEVLVNTMGKAQVRKVARALGTKLGKQLAMALLKDTKAGRWTMGEFPDVVDENFTQRVTRPVLREASQPPFPAPQLRGLRSPGRSSSASWIFRSSRRSRT